MTAAFAVPEKSNYSICRVLFIYGHYFVLENHFSRSIIAFCKRMYEKEFHAVMKHYFF